MREMVAGRDITTTAIAVGRSATAPAGARATESRTTDTAGRRPNGSGRDFARPDKRRKATADGPLERPVNNPQVPVLRIPHDSYFARSDYLPHHSASQLFAVASVMAPILSDSIAGLDFSPPPIIDSFSSIPYFGIVDESRMEL